VWPRVDEAVVVDPAVVALARPSAGDSSEDDGFDDR